MWWEQLVSPFWYRLKSSFLYDNPGNGLFEFVGFDWSADSYDLNPIEDGEIINGTWATVRFYSRMI